MECISKISKYQLPSKSQLIELWYEDLYSVAEAGPGAPAPR